MMNLREDSNYIINKSIEKVLPGRAVIRALESEDFLNFMGRASNETGAAPGQTILIAVGKASWEMANAAYGFLGDRIDSGIVITKYEHSKGQIGNLRIYEAGHPVPDSNTYAATREVLNMTENLSENDRVVFFISGGGSALFELPKIPENEMEEITEKLLKGGADISEINTIRKHLSNVKGGRFALHLSPAKVFTIVLSDVLGDPLDMIASGPACPDTTTSLEALEISEKYGLTLSEKATAALSEETPKVLDNVSTVITGNVHELCQAARKAAESLSYDVEILTETLNTEARDAGKWLASLAKKRQKSIKKPLALIAGGETIVHVNGTGKGGRNQELVLSASLELECTENIAIFSVGSDGTDGPTDAAGGFSDGSTASEIRNCGSDPLACLENNDAYNALKAAGNLIITGPTGTNVNDISVALIKPTFCKDPRHVR